MGSAGGCAAQPHQQAGGVVMARELKAGKEKVFDVCDRLSCRGIRPTCERIRDEIGGGGDNIAKYLRAWWYENGDKLNLKKKRNARSNSKVSKIAIDDPSVVAAVRWIVEVVEAGRPLRWLLPRLSEQLRELVKSVLIRHGSMDRSNDQSECKEDTEEQFVVSSDRPGKITRFTDDDASSLPAVADG